MRASSGDEGVAFWMRWYLFSSSWSEWFCDGKAALECDRRASAAQYVSFDDDEGRCVNDGASSSIGSCCGCTVLMMPHDKMIMILMESKPLQYDLFLGAGTDFYFVLKHPISARDVRQDLSSAALMN